MNDNHELEVFVIFADEIDMIVISEFPAEGVESRKSSALQL